MIRLRLRDRLLEPSRCFQFIATLESEKRRGFQSDVLHLTRIAEPSRSMPAEPPARSISSGSTISTASSSMASSPYGQTTTSLVQSTPVPQRLLPLPDER